MNRQAEINAALVFLNMIRPSMYHPMGDKSDDEREKRLVEEAEKAQKLLDDFRKARAARLALDTLMPGWVDLDASDYLPQHKWHGFISNKREEWGRWFHENGVPPETVAKIFREQWPKKKGESSE